MKVRAIILQLVCAAVSLAALVWGYRLMLCDHAPVAFHSIEDDMSYAWYVPVFSLYVLWRERRELAASLGSPSPWGLLPLAGFLAIGFLGVRGSQLRFEIVAFAGLLVALAWTHFGRRAAARVLFPALFLLFCIPIAGFLDVFTVHLRLFAVSVAHAVLRAFGADVARQGTMLAVGGGEFAIDVAAPCSGLRSLMAMAALTAGYAYFTQPTWLRRGLLFALSIPIAIAGNVMRILTIALVGACCSPTFATGFYHDYSGYVVFLVAIALMIATGGLIDRLFAASTPTPQPPQPTPLTSRLSPLTSVLATALFVAAMAWQGALPEPVLAEPPPVALGELAGYSSVAGGPSEAELATLPKDTVILRRTYSDDFGRCFAVSAVVGGRSKSSIHRPELCLPSQGFEMSAPRTIEAGGADWRVLTIRRGVAAPIAHAYTFFNQDGFRTSSHVRRIFRDVWDRSVLNRIDRWVMLSVESNAETDAELAAFVDRLEGGMR